MNEHVLGESVAQTVERGLNMDDVLLAIAKNAGFERQAFQRDVRRSVHNLLIGGPRARGITVAVLASYLIACIFILIGGLVLIWPNSNLLTSALGPEARLLLLALASGVLGTTLSTLAELHESHDSGGVRQSEVAAYAIAPVFGVGIAFIFYTAIRGGLVTLSGAQVEGALNPYGIAAFAGLAGLFMQRAIGKLTAVSEAIFGSKAENRLSK